MIRLAPVNEHNWRLGLSVSQDQKAFVSDSNRLLARAYAYQRHRSRAFVIYDDETPVGMALYHDCPQLSAYDLSQLFIDERYQRCGFGKAATQIMLDKMRKDGRYQKVVLCYIDGNEAARRLYNRFGFVETGRDENEIIMERSL